MKKALWFILALLAIVLVIVIVFLYERSQVSLLQIDDNTIESVGHSSSNTENGETEKMAYTSITMEEAKEIFETKGDYIILDVRRADEFADGHIPGAINVANEEIIDTEPAALPDKNQVIYVYCRSGNRSKQASVKLAAMGYSNIIEFGGILDWTGEIE